MSYEAHLFVCTNHKEGKESCKGMDLCQRVKKVAKERWPGRVRVNKSGCLGHCSRGIVSVLYPKGEWHFKLKTDDDEKLLKSLESLLES